VEEVLDPVKVKGLKDLCEEKEVVNFDEAEPD